MRLALVWASTVHKVQVLRLEQGVIDLYLRKPKLFGTGKIYAMLSREKTYYHLYHYSKINEMLKQNNLFSI